MPVSELVYVDACVRGERSRTRRLAAAFLERYAQRRPGDRIRRRDLAARRLQPQYPEILAQRDALWAAGRLSEPMFDDANQFARADKIVIAAPFWDLSFPAILRIYLERVSVVGITFAYDGEGEQRGLCRAEKLLFITTRGGNFSAPEKSWMELGAKHLEALCTVYGIPDFQLLYAEGLDDVRTDGGAVLANAMERGRTLAESF